MAGNENELINSIDRLPERMATMLTPALAEALKTSINNISHKVGGTNKASSAKILQDENRLLQLEVKNLSLRMAKTTLEEKNLKQEQQKQFKFLNSISYTTAQLDRMDKVKQQQLKFLNAMSFTPEQLDKINEKQNLKFLNSIAYTPTQLKQLDKAFYENKLKELEVSHSKMLPSLLKQTFSSSYNAPNVSPKPLKTSTSMWHNLDLLSKGAMPLAWKDAKGAELLGQILNITKGSYKLEKEDNKIWTKIWKDSLKSGMRSGIGAASSAIAPLAGGLATMAGFTALQSLVKMSGNNPLVRQGALYAMVLAPAITNALGAMLPQILGHVVGESISKIGVGAMLKGTGKFALAGAGIAAGGYEAYSAYSNYGKGNTGVAIGDAISSIAGFVGAFLPGWFKLVLLIPLLWEGLKKWLHLGEDTKESPMDRWLRDLGVGSQRKQGIKSASPLGNAIDFLTPSEKENLKNTMEVINDFQKKVGGGAYISSITGGVHNPFSGHYQGKKFDVGLLNKSEKERIKEFRALTSTSGVNSIGFETPSKAKYESFKRNLIKENIDVSKLKPYYWTKESSGEHFDVATKKRITEKVSTGTALDSIQMPKAPEIPSAGSASLNHNNQNFSTTVNRINSNDPGKRKSSTTTVLNSLVYTQH